MSQRYGKNATLTNIQGDWVPGDVRETASSIIALLKVTIPLAFAVSTLLASDAPSVVISR